MIIAIGTYANIEDTYLFQNFFKDQTRVWQGKSYVFAGFGYSGSTIDAQGGNVSAQLVFGVNDITLNLAKEAADNRYTVEIQTVWLDPESLTEKASYMLDVFMITGFEHDNSRLSMRLGSPLDAISADVPRRRLTEPLVGSLPSTGQLSLI